MYIFLLWTRYLKTRRLAFICMGSVMLGVATLIVVNSVMSGFGTKLTQKLHDMQSDVIIESTDMLYGFPMTAEEMMARIRQSPANDHIKAMAPSVDLFAIMAFPFRGTTVTQRVRLVGVDPEYQKHFPGFAEYLQQDKRKQNPSFDVSDEALRRWQQLHPPGREDPIFQQPRRDAGQPVEGSLQLPAVKPGDKKPLKRVEDLPPIDPPPPVVRKPHGIIVGYALAHIQAKNPETGAREEDCILERGDGATIMTISAEGVQPVWDEFIVCDYVKSEMSDFDATIVYVPLDYLQRLRTMEGRVNTLQIRLKDQAQFENVKEILKRIFPERRFFVVSSWKDKQGTLLAAISIERGILNLLLFMIIGVAGFGILAIFSMIVTEKTRDIGILKSLGASGRGVLSIFLGYGLLLGLVGAVLGTGLGLLITYNVNEIEKFISKQTGAELFDRSIYYFSEIPIDVRAQHILAVNLGAVLIAVVFSILPALKASWLRPVQALRYE